MHKDAVDFLKRLLAFNPKKRITAADALGHAYLKPFRDRDTELSLSRSVRVAVEDAKRLSIKDYRTRLYREIQENLARLKAARSPPRAVIPMADHADQAPASLAGAPRPAREKDATRPREQSSRAKPGPVEPDASAFAALSIGDRRHAPSQRSGAGGGAVAASVEVTSPPKGNQPPQILWISRSEFKLVIPCAFFEVCSTTRPVCFFANVARIMIGLLGNVCFGVSYTQTTP